MLVPRIALFIILIAILISGLHFIVLYWFILWLSLEGLNHFDIYKLNPKRNTLNIIFITYLYIIFIERIRYTKFSAPWELAINCLEHIAFAWVVCAQLYFWTIIITKKVTKNRILILASFNVLGLFNEIYQQMLKNSSHWYALTNDAYKDILMNLVGSILFLFTLNRLSRINVSAN
jgi:hypothetical protein